MKAKKILSMILATTLFAAASGCGGGDVHSEPAVNVPSWETFEISEDQSELYSEISIAVEKVDSDKKTAVASVTLPDIAKYLKMGDDYDGSTISTEIEFPIEEVGGEWQIASAEPIKDYIYREATDVLYDAIEAAGGITIDFELGGAVK